MDQTSLLSDLGLGELSPEDQAIVVEKMTEAVLKRIVSEFLSELSPEEIQEFNSISEEASPEEVETFFRSHIPDHDARVDRIVSEFKSEMKASLDSLTNQD